jgi:glucose/arabinose dehydrogenase
MRPAGYALLTLLFFATTACGRLNFPSTGEQPPATVELATAAATSAPAGAPTASAAGPAGALPATPAAAPSSPARVATATTRFDPRTTTIRLEPFAGGLRSPTDIVSAGDGSGRLFVVEKAGTIRIVRGGALAPQPFLDITALVGSNGSEQGLLGLAFHPQYRTNGQFYVNYTDKRGNTVVSRYKVSDQPERADAASASLILGVDQPYPNHNGGNLVFGPDGYLYIGLGDGGSAGDPHGNGQNPNALLGKMLRIDVDHGAPYAIPPDNPFVGRSGYRPEVWALGLRNPWRYSFDRATGNLYIADVGQNVWEEVDFQPAGSRGGENYGWNKTEGAHCYPPRAKCDPAAFVLPIGEYSHDKGWSITGGQVYRGAAQPALTGAYFFADYCSGQFWSLHRGGDGAWVQTELLKTSVQVSSFGEDEAGEIYVAGLADGRIYHLAAAGR